MSYPTLPDDIVTDWYAGAHIATDRPEVDSLDEWEPGDATVAFSDIGIHGDGTPHAQLVIYVAPHDDSPLRGCSAELSVADARLIARRLNEWANAADIGPVEAEGIALGLFKPLLGEECDCDCHTFNPGCSRCQPVHLGEEA